MVGGVQARVVEDLEGRGPEDPDQAVLDPDHIALAQGLRATALVRLFTTICIFTVFMLAGTHIRTSGTLWGSLWLQ